MATFMEVHIKNAEMHMRKVYGFVLGSEASVVDSADEAANAVQVRWHCSDAKRFKTNESV